MKRTADVIIVGGGIIGLTTALFLAKRKVSVIVLDRTSIGTEASWAGAGILPPAVTKHARSSLDHFRAFGTEHFPEFSANLKTHTGIDNGFIPSGGIDLKPFSDHQLNAEWASPGVICNIWSREEALANEPKVEFQTDQVHYFPQMAQIRNPRHMRALQLRCQQLGVDLRPGHAASNLQFENGRVNGVETPLGTFSAARYLIATGAWSNALTNPFHLNLRIKPIRGQIVLLKPDFPVLQRLLLHDNAYLVPRADGRILVGSTEEDVGFVKETTVGGISQLLRFASELVPDLVYSKMETSWAGLRPGTQDGLPVVDRIPECENAFIAAGHFRYGVQLSLATAQVMTEMMTGENLTLPNEDFALARFDNLK